MLPTTECFLRPATDCSRATKTQVTVQAEGDTTADQIRALISASPISQNVGTTTFPYWAGKVERLGYLHLKITTSVFYGCNRFESRAILSSVAEDDSRASKPKK
jgi:hypothetical protein